MAWDHIKLTLSIYQSLAAITSRQNERSDGVMELVGLEEEQDPLLSPYPRSMLFSGVKVLYSSRSLINKPKNPDGLRIHPQWAQPAYQHSFRGEENIRSSNRITGLRKQKATRRKQRWQIPPITKQNDDQTCTDFAISSSLAFLSSKRTTICTQIA